jgi:acetyl esterase/lipase
MNTRNSTGTVQAVIQADLVYARVGGTSLRLDLYTPSEASSGLPTLLYLHGGAWAVGDKSDAVAERLMPIVANGFAVARVNYRLIPSVRFPAPVHDVKAAVRWLRANATEYGLDPDRIAIGGVSAGGHLASLTALTAGDAQLEGNVGDHLGVSSAVSAVVAYCPTSDFLLSGGRNTLETQILPPPDTAALLGLDRIDDDPELARSASPRHRVHAGAPPHLILHGDRDAMVNHEQSRVLHEALSAVGAQSIYVLIAGAGHEGPEFVAPAITTTVAASTSTAGLELQSSARTRLSR